MSGCCVRTSPGDKLGTCISPLALARAFHARLTRGSTKVRFWNGLDLDIDSAQQQCPDFMSVPLQGQQTLQTLRAAAHPLFVGDPQRRERILRLAEADVRRNGMEHEHPPNTMRDMMAHLTDLIDRGRLTERDFLGSANDDGSGLSDPYRSARLR